MKNLVRQIQKQKQKKLKKQRSQENLRLLPEIMKNTEEFIQTQIFLKEFINLTIKIFHKTEVKMFHLRLT